MKTARAFYNHGRWVAPCPETDCTDARLVYEVNPRTGIPTGRRLTQDACANGHPFAIEMPDEQTEAQIVTTLAERAEDKDKGWYPKDHPQAVLDGKPSGQSIKELKDENARVAQWRAERDEQRKRHIAETLAGLGIEVRPDGTFEGKI